MNAMNFAWAPDNEWDYIAELTGDATWSHKHMRRHFIDVENCTYAPYGTPGHGFDGYIKVSSLIVLPLVALWRPRLTEIRQVTLTKLKLFPHPTLLDTYNKSSPKPAMSRRKTTRA